MNQLFNLARMLTATTGTGTITLTTAPSGFLTFAQAGVPNGAVVTYAIDDTPFREIGQGTFNSTANTLTRDVVYRSTAGAGNTSKIELSGTAQVFITPAAEDFSVTSGVFTLVCTGQSNAFGVGDSDGDTSPGGDLYINQTGGGIKIWHDGAQEWRTAEYGHYPLPTNPIGPSGHPSANVGIAYLNARRASGIDPIHTEYRLILVAIGGTSISNYVSLKEFEEEVTGQFMLTYLQQAIIESHTRHVNLVIYGQGESDRAAVSGNSTPDTYVGGKIDSNSQYGNNADGLLAGQVNPIYPWFNCPVEMVDTVVANGGYSFGNSYETAFRVLMGFYRGLQSFENKLVLTPSTPIIALELGMTVAGIDYQRNDFFWKISHGCDWDSHIFVTPTAGLELSRITNESGAFSNINHWSSPSINIIGQRVLQTHLSQSRAGIKDSQGRATAPRTFLQITNNIDQYGISNSTDGAYYLLTPDQVRNGASVVSNNSIIILPTPYYQMYLGSVDVEVYVSSIASGTTKVAPSINLNYPNPILGLTGNIGPMVLGGQTYNVVYELPTIGRRRFTSGVGTNWQLESAQVLPGGGIFTITGELGIRTLNPDAMIELGGTHSNDPYGLLMTTTMAGDHPALFGGSIAPTFTPAADTIDSFMGMRLLPSIAGVTANLTSAYGIWSRIGFSTGYSGTIAKGASIYAAAPALPGSVAGTVTDFSYLHIETNAGMGAGKVGKLYGLFIDALDPTLTSSNTAYAIRQVGAGAHSYFDARIGLGKEVPLAQLHVAGDRSLGEWTTFGRQIALDTAVLTDNEGGVAVPHRVGSFSIDAVTLACITPRTLTNASSLYISGPPLAGTNISITNRYALYVATGDIYAVTGEVRASKLRTDTLTLGSTAVTSTGTQLNYLSGASGTTGTGNLVFAASPTLATPILGVATATSVNKVAITAPATSATLTIANSKTATFSNTLTLAGTDGSTLNIGAGGTLGSNAFTSGGFAPLASPTFTGVVTMPSPFTLGSTSVTATGTQLNYLSGASGTTGTGNLAFATSPTLATPILGVATATSINKVAITVPATGSTLTITDGKTLTASNTLTFAGTDGSTLNIGAGGTLGSNAFTGTAYAPLASPAFTGAVSITGTPTPLTINATNSTWVQGNLGIVYTTTSTGATTQLELVSANNAVDRAIIHARSTASGNTSLWVASAGFVGIGTAVPEAVLHVTRASGGTSAFSAYFQSTATSSTPDVLIVDADTSNVRASLQIKGSAGAVETAFFGGNGNVGLGTVAPAQKLHVSTTTGDTGIRVDAYHTGANFYNSWIQLNTPRSDTADGATAVGRGYIVTPGNSATTAGSIFVGANTATGVVTGADTAIRNNQGVIEVTSAGTLDLWRVGVSYFHADSTKTVLGGSTLPTFGAITAATGVGFTAGTFGIPRFTNDTSGPRLLIGKSRGSITTPAAVIAGDQLGDILIAGDDGVNAAGTIATIAARIVAYAVGTVSSGVVPARFEISTRNAAGTLAARVGIGAEGGLSVGSTTDPGIGAISATGAISTSSTISSTIAAGAGNKTSITALTDASLLLRRTVTTAVQDNYGAVLGFANQSVSTPNLGAAIATKMTATSLQQYGLAFLTHSSGTIDSTLTEAMLLKHNGFLGLGTTDPQRPIHITATIPGIRLTDSDAGADADGSWDFRTTYDDVTKASTIDLINIGVGMGNGGMLARFEKDQFDVGRIAFSRLGTSPSAIIISQGNLDTVDSDGFRFEITNPADSTFATFHAASTVATAATQKAYRTSNFGTDTFYSTYGGSGYFGGDVEIRGTMAITEPSGQSTSFSTSTQLLTLAAAATTTSGIVIPAETIVFAVSVRVVTAIPTAATFDIGVSGTTNRYAAGLSTAAGTTSPGTRDGPRYYPLDTPLVITPNLTPATATGQVRITVHFCRVFPPAS